MGSHGTAPIESYLKKKNKVKKDYISWTLNNISPVKSEDKS